jgi:hypothetical protein
VPLASLPADRAPLSATTPDTRQASLSLPRESDRKNMSTMSTTVTAGDARRPAVPHDASPGGRRLDTGGWGTVAEVAVHGDPIDDGEGASRTVTAGRQGCYAHCQCCANVTAAASSAPAPAPATGAHSLLAGAIRQTLCGPSKMQRMVSPGLLRASGAGSTGAQDLSDMNPH